MKPIVLQGVAKEDLAIFRKIEAAMEVLPEIDLGKDENGYPVLVSCHMLCRAFAVVFPQLKCADGYFYKKGYEHSWLETPNGCIIDVYPIAVLGGPILVLKEGFLLSLWGRIYIEAELPRLRNGKFLGDTARVKTITEATLNTFRFIPRI